MRVIKHFFKKRVKRDEIREGYDPGNEMAEDFNKMDTRTLNKFVEFVEDDPKEDAYDDISEFIKGS